jgi:hypothetical protein
VIGEVGGDVLQLGDGVAVAVEDLARAHREGLAGRLH